jgi:hypothetical protein
MPATPQPGQSAAAAACTIRMHGCHACHRGPFIASPRRPHSPRHDNDRIPHSQQQAGPNDRAPWTLPDARRVRMLAHPVHHVVASSDALRCSRIAHRSTAPYFSILLLLAGRTSSPTSTSPPRCRSCTSSRRRCLPHSIPSHFATPPALLLPHSHSHPGLCTLALHCCTPCALA